MPAEGPPTMDTAPHAPARLVYLDWLRVAAFGLLILYHVGMFCVTWGRTVLVAATAAGCWLAFELARRVDPLRPLLGLGPRLGASPPLDPAAAAP
jgi:hypothetical protein